MGTIGLAHRPHPDFVVDWLEPEPSTADPDEGLSERIEVVLARAGVRLDRRAPTRHEVRTAEANVDDAESEAWLLGEPTF